MTMRSGDEGLGIEGLSLGVSPAYAYHYIHSGNEPRVVLYGPEFIDDFVDLRQLGVDAIASRLVQAKLVADIGAGRSRHPQNLQDRFVQANIKAVDPIIREIGGLLTRAALIGTLNDRYGENQAFHAAIADQIIGEVDPGPPVRRVIGSVNEIPIDDGSADVIYVYDSAYHASGDDMINQAVSHVKSKHKPNGIAVYKTSGRDNKKESRQQEWEIAEKGGWQPPPLMNEGFTMEIAMELLPQLYNYVYVFYQKTKSNLREDNDGIEAGLNSHFSLWDLYRKPDGSRLSKEEFEPILFDVVMPQYEKAIRDNGKYAITIHHGILVCSDEEVDIEHPDFELITAR